MVKIINIPSDDELDDVDDEPVFEKTHFWERWRAENYVPEERPIRWRQTKDRKWRSW